MNIGFYITDASFDKASNVSVISFIEKTSKRTFTEQYTNFKNSFEAEKKGIINCAKDAIGKYKDIIIFCDNKHAVFYARKELTTKLRVKFDSVQFVWLPREFLSEVDFLTKNITDVEMNQELKNTSQIDKLSSTLLIRPDKGKLITHLKSILNKVPNSFKFKSSFFTHINEKLFVNNKDRDNIEEDLLNLSYILDLKDIKFLRNLILMY